MKLLYKTKKWDNEMAAIGKVREQIRATHHGMDSEELNIRNILWSFLDPESYPYRNPLPNLDEGSVLDMIASNYMNWAWEDYRFNRPSEECIGHLYQSILAYAKSYAIQKSGIEPKNPGILYDRQKGRHIECICFHAAVINQFELFEEYAEGIGAELINAFYHQNYDQARILVSKLPDSKEMYQKHMNRMSYYYEAIFMKDLYMSILDKDESKFHTVLEERIRYVRKGYVMPIDAVSVAMIRFAKTAGISNRIDIIEIPPYLLDNELTIDKENYTLPNTHQS